MNDLRLQEKIKLLNYLALQLRIDSIRATTHSNSGHPTSCLSAADIISTLFFDIQYTFRRINHPS